MPRINLIPLELRPKTVRKKKYALAGLALFLLLGLSGTYGYVFFLNLNGERQLAALEGEIKQLQPLLDKGERMAMVIREAQSTMKMYQVIKEERLPWSQALLEISKVMPDAVTLLEVKVESPVPKAEPKAEGTIFKTPGQQGDGGDKGLATVPVQGTLILRGGSQSFISIGEVLLQLRKLPCFNEIRIKWAEDTTPQGQPYYRFDLYCYLNKEMGGSEKLMALVVESG